MKDVKQIIFKKLIFGGKNMKTKLIPILFALLLCLTGCSKSYESEAKETKAETSSLVNETSMSSTISENS